MSSIRFEGPIRPSRLLAISFELIGEEDDIRFVIDEREHVEHGLAQVDSKLEALEVIARMQRRIEQLQQGQESLRRRLLGRR